MMMRYFAVWAVASAAAVAQQSPAVLLGRTTAVKVPGSTYLIANYGNFALSVVPENGTRCPPRELTIRQPDRCTTKTTSIKRVTVSDEQGHLYGTAEGHGAEPFTTDVMTPPTNARLILTIEGEGTNGEAYVLPIKRSLDCGGLGERC